MYVYETRLFVSAAIISLGWGGCLISCFRNLFIQICRVTKKMSTMSIATNDGTGGASDSNSIIYQFQNSSKGERDVSNAPVSRFKGVVDQQNGHWGAQIYANHQRIWLGTFKSEKQAATAYDSATIKLRGGDSHRNFPWTSITVQEPDFQRQFSEEKVLKMIKDGSYPTKFADFLRTRLQSGGTDGSLCMGLGHSNGELTCRQLFRKALTPSDVGKLNRLVIPKKFALKYFPCVNPEFVEERVAGEKSNIELVFFDGSMKSWKFRYCYWKSSQSFVFTKGWNRFVKEKKLKAKDMVTFCACDCKDGGSNQGQALCMIDVSYSDGVESNDGGVEDLKEDARVLKGTLKLEIGSSFDDGEKMGLDVGKNNDEWHWQVKKEEAVEENLMLGVESMGGQRKGFRLFGVQII